MSRLPRISLITPSFNQGQYIEQTIRSVLDQDYPNLEYIVIDGGSTDDTVNILQQYNASITHWVSEPDKGQTDAINKGFALATGEIINWLNSDDYLEPGTLLQVAAAFQDKTVQAVTTVVRNFMEDGTEWDEQMRPMASADDYLTQSFLNQPGTFFRRSAWQACFPLPVQLRYTMDQYLWFNFWLQNEPAAFKVEDYTSAWFRRHASSKTTVTTTDTLYNHLSPEFFNEHHLIFWSFFSTHDPQKAAFLADYFRPGYNYQSNQISFPAGTTIAKDRIDRIFELYLFQLIKEDFRLGFFHRMKAGLTLIQDSELLHHHSRLLAKMKLAALGGGLVRQYRNMYWKMKSIAKQG